MKISSQKVKTDEILAVCAICNLHSSNNLALKLQEKYTRFLPIRRVNFFIYIITKVMKAWTDSDKRNQLLKQLFLLGLSKGNARVEIPATFFFSFGRKSQSSPHHACASFWLWRMRDVWLMSTWHGSDNASCSDNCFSKDNHSQSVLKVCHSPLNNNCHRQLQTQGSDYWQLIHFFMNIITKVKRHE